MSTTVASPACAPRRAASMPPAARRAAIIEATLPLLLENGPAITTRQIAEAAGIAEGTIFRVFADKDEVIAATVEAAFDTTPLERTIDAIDPSLGFEAQLEVAVAAMQERTARVWRLLSSGASGRLKGPPSAPPSEPTALSHLFARHADLLTTDPAGAALRLRALAFAVTHPAIWPGQPMAPAEVVALLLDGLRAPMPTPSPSKKERR